MAELLRAPCIRALALEVPPLGYTETKAPDAQGALPGDGRNPGQPKGVQRCATQFTHVNHCVFNILFNMLIFYDCFIHMLLDKVIDFFIDLFIDFS